MPKSTVSKANATVAGSSTSGDTAVTLISADNLPANAHHVRVTNEGGVAGFVSFDGGTTKHRLPADQVVNTFYDVWPIASVLLYRIASGTNLTGVYAEAWGN